MHTSSALRGHMTDKPQTGTIMFEVALLTVVVFLVDEWLIRGALAFIPAMLLAQRALDSAAAKASAGLAGGQGDLRGPINKLEAIIREFYAMCHLMGSEGITSEQALERTNELEKDLTRLLDEVTEAPPAMAEALPELTGASPEVAGASPEVAGASPEVAGGLPTL